MKIKWKNLITALVIPLAVGGISGFVTQKYMNVFKSLDKPPLTPPEWAFPVIWTILFVLMGISTYIISVSDTEKSLKNSAYLNCALQLAVNFFWAVIFFALVMSGAIVVLHEPFLRQHRIYRDEEKAHPSLKLKAQRYV